MKKIAIIGGGIGGLALANSLQQQGLEFHLFESAPAFKEVGAGIGISHSTVSILEKLNLGTLFQSKSKLIAKAAVVDKKKSIIRKLPVDKLGYIIHRSALIELLAKKINSENYSLNSQIADISTTGLEAMLTFKNGRKQAFDYIVACDGINSMVRNKYLPFIKKRYSGQTIWRGISKCSLPEDFQECYYEFWGDNLRFATIPMNNGQYYWYAVKNSDSDQKDNLSTQKEDLKKLFNNFIPEISNVIEHSGPIVRNDMWDLEPGKRDWHFKNIGFLGDAIHATTPNLAQGGCQAIEDAYTLSLLIKKDGLSKEIFKKFYELRESKVNYIVNLSWKIGKISHQDSRLKEMLTTFMVKNLLPKNYFINQNNKLTDLSYLKSLEVEV